MSGDRKDDHVRIAVNQQRARCEPASGEHNEFDDVSFVHHALAGIDSAEVILATRFADIDWPVPLYINAMTGGTAKAGAINRDLAIAARETGVPCATGSMSMYFADPDVGDTFAVMRSENPHGFLMANINATTTVDDARRAIDLLGADALQIHLNAVQEIVMPEGDRSFSAWASRIEEIAAAVDVPVIVKEVGFGLSRETITLLKNLGVRVADVGGRGGTNFARVENSRRSDGGFAFLHNWGQSTPACLLDGHDTGLALLASGGVRHPLDAARSLALGAGAVGASGVFLNTLLEDGVGGLVALINGWLDQLRMLMTVLGAPSPAALSSCDILVAGNLRTFCVGRGIDTRGLATRSHSTGDF